MTYLIIACVLIAAIAMWALIEVFMERKDRELYFSKVMRECFYREEN